MEHWEGELISQSLAGRNPAFLEEIRKIPQIARCAASVLISGETGTGKGVCARLIHRLGKRANKPLVSINCGALPPELAENELFGHRNGAFTGATAIKKGLIGEAEGGSLFLDEIDSLPYSAQVKLLRFLQEKTYRPLGSTKECRADVRIIATSSMAPEEVLASGRIRRDLYYRINVLQLRLPPLRNRREDIPLLAVHFLREHLHESEKRIEGFSLRAMQKLLFYDWPGNVRELAHVIERAVAHLQKGTIDACDIGLPEVAPFKPLNDAKERFVVDFERRYVQQMLSLAQGNISEAARASKKHRRAFWQLIRKHRIDTHHYREIQVQIRQGGALGGKAGYTH
ncbi:MAG: sigma-54 dependent transcriptional regulator [Syntrophobacteraceae bacterium]